MPRTPLLIARSKERESVTEDGVTWWKEYHIAELPFDGGYQLSMRYLARVNGKTYARVNGRVALFTDPEATWQVWSRGDTPQEAIADVIGDSDFSAAESLHELHREAVAEWRQARETGERLRQARERKERAARALNDWVREQERAFQKRHGGKPADAYAKALAKTKARLRPEYERLLADVKAAEQALDAMSASATV